MHLLFISKVYKTRLSVSIWRLESENDGNHRKPLKKNFIITVLLKQQTPLFGFFHNSIPANQFVEIEPWLKDQLFNSFNSDQTDNFKQLQKLLHVTAVISWQKFTFEF